ncbi:carbon-nitrogen hydrolase family protein [Colwellia echini]|uniref:carbon-nitrogen hydrolase family protein n=1 Tax=Colwellia echini TaxID=1982103 RepID=UPI001FE4AD83|nr:carbon-nitrogen hydrolase family protein [Colwellia echini]
MSKSKCKLKLSAIQLTSAADVASNLATIADTLEKITSATYEEAGNDIQHLVVLPECCLYFGGKESDQLTLAKSTTSTAEHDDKTQHLKVKQRSSSLSLALGALAKKYAVYLVAGTIPILSESEEKFTNSSCIFNPNGELIGQYDKIHLFDVTVSDNTKSYCESRFTQAGDAIKVIKTPLANIGLSVCFDLRFPSLFQQLTQFGADIITIPSAFTKVTGKAHWQTLLQARAIENQVYIIAAGQEGVHENGRETWGHSMIINPWGEIEQIIETGVGYITVDYQPQETTRIRNSMPLKTPFITTLTEAQ